MPLKLVPPRKGKTPNWSIRGTYLGIHVDRTCGTDRRSVARARLAKIREAIERGEYPPAKVGTGEQPTFAGAALTYMRAGHRTRYVARLIRHFAETPLADIDQAAIDGAALALHPHTTPATRNTCVYTPMSAILRHAGVRLELKRPPNAKGRVVTDWLKPEDATTIIQAAESFDREYALLLRFLLYTGVRLGEALHLEWDALHIDDGGAWMRRLKGGPTGAIRLRADLCEALTTHKATSEHRRVFRFHQGGWLKHLLTRAKLAALGIPCPNRRPKGWRQPPHRLAWVNHHSFRHTFASWLRRYGGADVQGLVATGNWRDPRSAARYAHAVASDEWNRVEDLPSIGGRKAG